MSKKSKRWKTLPAGLCFGVPLEGGGFAAGIVARSPGGGVFLGYFFDRRWKEMPDGADVLRLTPEDAVLVAKCGELGLQTGEWKAIAQTKEWNPETWPVPVFGRVESVEPEIAWRVFYSDSLDLEDEKRCSIAEAKRLPGDATWGYGAIEAELSDRLRVRDSNEDREHEPESAGLLDATIHEFWSWFATVAESLDKSGFQDARALERLDSWMKPLGGVSWELGPGERANNALTITPDRDPSLINATLRIVALAPKLPGWEFFPARRPRKAALKLELETSTGERVSIDATRWRYVLFQYDDGKIELVVEQRNLGELAEEDRYTAAVLIVDGLLGEAVRLLTVVGIETSLKLSAEESEQASPIKDLAAHIEQLRDDEE